MPKKSLLHELAVRVPTLLIDEYRASSTCVCGAKLQTSSNAPRVRVHQDGGGACATLQCGICDRDELAVLNITLAALRCLRGQPWPEHLRRQPA